MNPQEWNPGKLLELSGYYWKTCTLHAAVKLDVFTAIDDQQLSSKEIAAKLKVENKALESIGYCQQNNPSAENVAKYIYDKVQVELPDGVRLRNIRVVEEPGCSAKFYE